MKEKSEITKPDRKGCSRGVSLLFYFVSLCLAVPLFTLLSFAIITILTKNQDSPLIYLMLVVLLALYTWAFFYMARRSFGFGPGRIVTNEGRYKEVVTADGVQDVVVKENIVQERKLERSQDRTKGLTFGILWLVIGGLVVLPRLVGGFGWLAKRMGWSNNGDDRLAFFLTAITMVIILVSYSFYARRRLYVKRMDRSLLWLRRFHQDGMFPFDLVLDDVCRGIALPLTVADTTVSKSELAGQLHPVYNIGILTLGLAFMGGFAAWAFFPLSKIALVSIPLGIAGALLMILGNRIGGREDLREDQNQEKIEKIFNAIDHQLPISSTMAVIRLSDENWKNWVGEFIERADAVIMDVTHLNQNLGWELNACREKLLPGSMILACCRDKDSREDPWLVLEPELNRYLGASFHSSCQKFTYYKPPNIFKLINILKFPGMSQGIRQRQAWYLRKKYEQDLLNSISLAFAEKDKFRKQEIG